LCNLPALNSITLSGIREKHPLECHETVADDQNRRLPDGFVPEPGVAVQGFTGKVRECEWLANRESLDHL